MARILLAEDTNYVQFVLEKALSPLGHQLILAKDGLEARDILLEQNIDLVLLDLRLPGMNGDAIIREVHREKPKQPFMVISGYIEEESKSSLYRLGAAALMKKPVDIYQLTAAVERILKPVRRILLTGYEEDSKAKYPFQHLEKWDYQVESFLSDAVVKGQLMHREFDGVLIWTKPTNRRSAFNLCQKIRNAEEWLPVFMPAPLMPPTPEQLDLVPLPWPVESGQELLRVIAGRIGLQKVWTNRESAYILLAGKIDREDILESATQAALASKKNLVVDLFDVRYFGPYCQKCLETTVESSSKVHLQMKLVLPGQPDVLSPKNRDWIEQGNEDKKFQVFPRREKALEETGFENLAIESNLLNDA
jgi:DNA-binding response OmpR family regulator